MTNFNQKCFIEKDFNTKEPKLELRTSKSGKNRLTGRLSWLDGKNEEGRNIYTKFNFSTYSPQIIELIQSNPNSFFEVKGFLKNESWKDKDKWFNYQEIRIIEASIFEKIDDYSKTKGNAYVEEVEDDTHDSEIPF